MGDSLHVLEHIIDCLHFHGRHLTQALKLVIEALHFLCKNGKELLIFVLGDIMGMTVRQFLLTVGSRFMTIRTGSFRFLSGQ